VTPAHDYIDFDVGKRHNLEMISIINEKGELNEKCGNFSVSIVTCHLLCTLQGACELAMAEGENFILTRLLFLCDRCTKLDRQQHAWTYYQQSALSCPTRRRIL